MTHGARANKRLLCGLIVGFAAVLCTGHAHSQRLLPENASVELHELPDNGMIRLVARNSLHGPVQVGLYLTNVERLVPDQTQLLRVIPARSEIEIVRLDAAEVAARLIKALQPN